MGDQVSQEVRSMILQAVARKSVVFNFSHFISYSTLDSKLGQTTTRTVSGLRSSFPFTSLLNSSTPPTSTDLVSASSRFSFALGSSSGSTFLSLPGSTLSSALESCFGGFDGNIFRKMFKISYNKI